MKEINNGEGKRKERKKREKKKIDKEKKMEGFSFFFFSL